MISQANVSRGKAVKALKNNNNDIVNAIMVSRSYKMKQIRYKYFNAKIVATLDLDTLLPS